MIDAKHLTTAIRYMTIEVITMYHNNIKAQFVQYIKRYVNVVWNIKDELANTSSPDASSEEKNTILGYIWDWICFALATFRSLEHFRMNLPIYKAI